MGAQLSPSHGHIRRYASSSCSPLPAADNSTVDHHLNLPGAADAVALLVAMTRSSASSIAIMVCSKKHVSHLSACTRISAEDNGEEATAATDEEEDDEEEEGTVPCTMSSPALAPTAVLTATLAGDGATDAAFDVTDAAFDAAVAAAALARFSDAVEDDDDAADVVDEVESMRETPTVPSFLSCCGAETDDDGCSVRAVECSV